MSPNYHEDMGRPLPDPAEHNKNLELYSDAIREIAAKRGQELTRHLLSFARRQRLNPEVVSLATRAPGLRTLLTSSAGVNIDVVVDCPDDLWTVEVDVNELELAVLNMASETGIQFATVRVMKSRAAASSSRPAIAIVKTGVSSKIQS